MATLDELEDERQAPKLKGHRAKPRAPKAEAVEEAEPKGRRAKPRKPRKRGTTAKKGKAKTRIFVSADQLPRRTLAGAARCPGVAGHARRGPATWEDTASAMGIGAGVQANKYFLWSGQAYNLIQKNDDGTFSLSEIGRKILAPTRQGEDREATVQAVLTPVILSRFFTDYNGSPFPTEEHIGNILEHRYGVPRERIDEAKALIPREWHLRGHPSTRSRRLDVGATGPAIYRDCLEALSGYW